MSHIGNRDTLVMTVVVVLLGVLALLADLGLRLTWYGAGSRRSYGDKNSKGQGIIIVVAIAFAHPGADHRAPDHASPCPGSASTWPTPRAPCSRATPRPSHAPSRRSAGDTDPLDQATKATEHLYIVNPLTKHKSSLNSLFSTHPPLEERIRLLRAM